MSCFLFVSLVLWELNGSSQRDILMDTYLATLLMRLMSVFAAVLTMNWAVGTGLASLVTQHPPESWH